MIKEFREFIMKGNVIDLAVAVGVQSTLAQSKGRESLRRMVVGIAAPSPASVAIISRPIFDPPVCDARYASRQAGQRARWVATSSGNCPAN